MSRRCLVLSPPVSTPAEPPSGAFLLAAGLAARGVDVSLLDLSLEFFHQVLTDKRLPGPNISWALRYLCDQTAYEPAAHRSALGHLHRYLKSFGAAHPGWALTLMDLEAPVRTHDLEGLAVFLGQATSPFEALYERVLDPVLDEEKPTEVLVSVAYLSQLVGALDLCRHLEKRGISPIVGGSLPRSLAHTGQGLERLRAVLPALRLDDGRDLLGEDQPLLSSLTWPRLISKQAYLSGRPIVPLTLSTGCFWNRCLFCPDRALPLVMVPEEAQATLLASMPAELKAKRPVVHLLDSAMPPGPLARFLPLAKAHQVDFYGFARPTRQLLHQDLIGRAGEAGCLMLQLGVEGGSGALLDRFDKGLNPDEARAVLRACAAAGVRTYSYLLFGLPGETEDDREKTRALMMEEAKAVDFLNLSLFNLPLDSELARRAAEFDICLGDFLDDDPLKLYRPFTQGGHAPRAEARRYLSEVFSPTPEIKAALLRTPRWLRAAHLALMALPGRRDGAG